ncbi:FMN-dependent NADH-azoreductase 2 [Geotalea uraniireducens]|uniref:FMN dependent NADH:quinone oxidoreductase n=1 Tax=Geotalea uraniireducens TaxID=351604 RepID=A0ABM8EMK9_9BACT|nr:NAD(P)H-dependent oxidoreductase [Geotalea uraniireducens]BDV43269.1 FMN-dependent NADH-azoreductase 2 [Geotalea uraniireducens]
MAKLLYVTCNLKSEEGSRSLSLGKKFLDEYLRFNPTDEVEFLDLYRDNIQRIDADVLSGWGKMAKGSTFASLDLHEQRKIGRIWSHADQFKTADKYVFVTPMFNLGFPAEFKMYIDAVCVVGKTFNYTPTGPVGLLKDQGRKCLHIHSSGGFHFGKEEDHSVPYLKSIMGFMGIEDFEAVVVEGGDAIPERAEEFIGRATEQAITLAATF